MVLKAKCEYINVIILFSCTKYNIKLGFILFYKKTVICQISLNKTIFPIRASLKTSSLPRIHIYDPQMITFPWNEEKNKPLGNNELRLILNLATTAMRLQPRVVTNRWKVWYVIWLASFPYGVQYPPLSYKNTKIWIGRNTVGKYPENLLRKFLKQLNAKWSQFLRDVLT